MNNNNTTRANSRPTYVVTVMEQMTGPSMEELEALIFGTGNTNEEED